jgi:hypothetical protein
MSIDLQHVFNEVGRQAPAHNLDAELVMRRGRRMRVRRRMAVGTTTLVGVGVVAVSSVALAGHLPGSGPVSSAVGPASGTGTSGTIASPEPTAPGPGTATPTGTPSSKGGTPPAELAAVALPDPAPGFPIRRWTDSVGLESGPPGQEAYWSATFGLAVTPPTTETDAAGSVSAYPTGPEVTILVNSLPMPDVRNGKLEGHPVIATPTVAGVTGHVTSYLDKDTPVKDLYFSSGRLSIKVVGFDGVSTAELVRLGNALTGLR